MNNASNLPLPNPVERIVEIGVKRYHKLMAAYEDPLVVDSPLVMAKLTMESNVVNAITQAANNVVKELTEPLKAIVNK
jgi:hypothetical protein